MTAPRRLVASCVATFLALTVMAATAGCATGDDSVAEVASAAITVAAASDLRPAFGEIGEAFTSRTGIAVTFTFGSSGQLSRQIINGAPYDLLASANVAYASDVIDSGRGVASSLTDYAVGRLVLWSPDGVELPGSLTDLADPRFRRIAIANPRHAPYGLAAEQALASAGVADDVADRLVVGENVSDAFEIVRSGNADVGIVALSVAIAHGGDYTLVPDDLHDPLRQAMVVTSTGAAGEAAGAFSTFVTSAEGRSIMQRYGFVPPGTPVGKAQ
jgi:molybdate transport system substrate-binding protein